MMKWTKQYIINDQDTDINDIVGTTAILGYLQDAAFSQMAGEGPSLAEVIESGRMFVIVKMSLSLYKPLFSQNKIAVNTWACESQGASFNRCYSIKRDGEIVAEATSVWALIDINSRRPVRVKDFENNYSVDAMLDIDTPGRKLIPEGVPLTLAGEYTVQYRDVDLNTHMNNTVYADLFCGFLPTMKNRRVVKFDINYRSEAPLGETYKIYVAGDGDETFYVRSQNGDKINAEAQIVLEAI